MRLAQNLKAIADPDDQSALGGKSHDALHDRREARDRTAAQIIAVAEAARQHNAIGTAERFILVPQHRGVLAKDAAQRMECVAIVERAGKPYDAPLHPASTSTR